MKISNRINAFLLMMNLVCNAHGMDFLFNQSTGSSEISSDSGNENNDFPEKDGKKYQDGHGNNLKFHNDEIKKRDIQLHQNESDESSLLSSKKSFSDKIESPFNSCGRDNNFFEEINKNSIRQQPLKALNHLGHFKKKVCNLIIDEMLTACRIFSFSEKALLGVAGTDGGSVHLFFFNPGENALEKVENVVIGNEYVQGFEFFSEKNKLRVECQSGLVVMINLDSIEKLKKAPQERKKFKIIRKKEIEIDEKTYFYGAIDHNNCGIMAILTDGCSQDNALKYKVKREHGELSALGAVALSDGKYLVAFGCTNGRIDFLVCSLNGKKSEARVIYTRNTGVCIKKIKIDVMRCVCIINDGYKELKKEVVLLTEKNFHFLHNK